MPLASRVRPALRRRLDLAGGPLTRVERRLPAGRDRLVVLLVDARPAGRRRTQAVRQLWMRRWQRAFGHDRVHLVPVEGDDDDHLAQTSLAVAALGPVDVLVDLLAGPADHHRVWTALFLHVRADGAYVLGRTGTGHRASAAALRGWWRTAPERAERPRLGPSNERELATELAASLGPVTAGPHALAATQRHRHHWKVREAALPALLPRREPDLGWTDVQVLPAGSLRPAAPVVHHGAPLPDRWLPECIDHPALRLRRYTDVGFGGRMLVHGRSTILPDAYSWPLAIDPNNAFAVSAGAEFARIPDEHLGDERLAGTYYLLDPNYAEYGHVLTELVGRLWGWDDAKARHPELKALLWTERDEPDTHPKVALARAYGIAAEDIVRIARPVRVDTLYAASPMWHNRTPYYVHPQLPAVWHRLGRGLGAGTAPTGERIFIGRSGGYARRVCRNDADVQAFFVERGFTVVYPEHLTLAEQAAIFAGARVVAGYAGSALFNVLFTHNLQALLVLTHHSYTARNEHLFGAALGVPVHYFWSRADLSHPPDRTTFAAVESPWEFDLAANRADLDQVLTDVTAGT